MDCLRIPVVSLFYYSELSMKVSHISISKFIGYSSLIFILVALFSCNSPQKPNRNSSFKDIEEPMIDRIQALSAKNHDESKTGIIDSLYRATLNITAEDSCEKYILESHFSGDSPSIEELYADSALAIIYRERLQQKIPGFYSEALRYKGKSLMSRGEYTNAYRCYYEGIKAAGQTDDTSGFLGDLGLISFRQGNYLQAAHFFKESILGYYILKKAHKTNLMNLYYLGSDYDNVGLCYDKAGMTDSAISYFNKGLEYLTDHQFDFPDNPKPGKGLIESSLGVLDGNLGTAYMHKGDLINAEICFKKGIRINRNGREPEDARLTEIKLADLYLQTSHLPEAKAVLDTLKAECDSARKNPYGNIEIRWYKEESKYYSLVKNPEIAYMFLNAYNIHKDSVEKVNKQLTTLDFNNLFSDINHEDSLEVLKKQNEMDNINSIVFMLFFALLIGAGVFISKNNRQLKILNKKILLQNVEMKQTLDALEQSQQENTRIMKMVAHDLRDPLGAMMSMITLLLEEEPDKKTREEFLRLMQTSGANLLDMIGGMLSSSTTLKDIKKQEVDMKALLEYCVDLLRFKASAKKQDILLSSEDITIQTDREKIWRVFSNLITNAIKFSPEKAIIEVAMYKKQDAVQISVKDAGIGIPTELKDKIFEMHTDKRRPGTQGEHSFGLGLSISRQIVNGLGGKIWFESKEGEGTTFYIELPA